MAKNLFEHIYEDLKSKILRGELVHGEQLYSSSELCELYKISNMTAVKVAATLRNDGLVKSIKGKGSFICHQASSRVAVQRPQREPRKLLFLSIKNKDFPESFLWRIGVGVHDEASRRCLAHNTEYSLPSPSNMPTTSDISLRDEDAIISLAPTALIGNWAGAMERGMRIISIDKVVDGMEAVLTDNHRGVANILDELEKLGHRRIAFCSRFSDSQNFINENERAYAFGFESERRNIAGEIAMGQDFSKLEELLKRQDAPTAFMFSQDAPALKFIKSMEAKGFSIPRDFSVTGFDGHSEKEPGLERLSTYAVDCEGMGRMAVAMLFETPLSGPCANSIRRTQGRLVPGSTIDTHPKAK